MTVDLRCGNVLDVLRTMPDESVHCCVTSPPYWGLRAYGTTPQVWQNGHEPCQEHQWGDAGIYLAVGNNSNIRGKDEVQRTVSSWQKATDNGNQHRVEAGNTCLACGAWRGELGLEPTPELYVEHLVAIFREVKRVMRDDATLWLNLGDSYAREGSDNYKAGPGALVPNTRNGVCRRMSKPPPGLKHKDLVGIPWMVAFALRADGYYLRSDIIWAKPNPMPESVRDRPTKAHEYIFLMSKSPRYYYDATAIMEDGSIETTKRYSTNKSRPHAARGTDFTPPSSPTLRPELFATLFTEDGSVNCRGWLDFGKSQVSINSTVTGNTERFQIVELIGFKVGLETPKGNLVVNLEIPALAPATLTSEFVPQFSQAALSEPVIPTITDATAPPSGAILASHVFADPVASTFERAKIVGLDCALISSELFSARITLESEKGQSTLFVWNSLAMAHNIVSFIPEGNNSITQNPPKRNKRSVWTVTTKPFKGAHFATFPPDLIEPMILAGTSERGVCPACGAPWERVTRASGGTIGKGSWTSHQKDLEEGQQRSGSRADGSDDDGTYHRDTLGWQPTCACNAGAPVPATVMDIFSGAGTTGVVSVKHNRNYIGIDLKAEYNEMARERIGKVQIELQGAHGTLNGRYRNS